MSEKIQLEQKLKLQRVELQKQANLVQSAEDKTRAELHELQVRGREECKGGSLRVASLPVFHGRNHVHQGILWRCICYICIPSQCLPLASSAEPYAGAQPGHCTELLMRPPGGLCDV